jgi:hypothetical protein
MFWIYILMSFLVLLEYEKVALTTAFPILGTGKDKPLFTETSGYFVRLLRRYAPRNDGAFLGGGGEKKVGGFAANLFLKNSN